MKKSLLWRLTKEGAFDSYILGTMHVKSKSAFNRINQIKSLIEETEFFAAEYDLEEAQNPKISEHLMIPGNGSLTELLGARKFERVKSSLLKSFGVDISHFQRFLPLIIINFIGEAILSKEYQLPLDVYLWEFAKEHDKKVIGIETLQAQHQVIRSLVLKDQLKMLKDLARNTSKYRRNLLKMAGYYESEDIHKLYKSGKKSLGKYKHLLLKNRNRIMADRFEELAKENSLFFAIGAGHLAGYDGVLKLLKNKNWKIEAL